MRAIAIVLGAYISILVCGSPARASGNPPHGGGVACRIEGHRIDLVFGDSGAPDCTPASVPDNYTFDVYVTGSVGDFSVVVTPGNANTAIIRPDNTPSGVKAEGVLLTLVGQYGPFENTVDVTFTVTRKGTAPVTAQPPAAAGAAAAPALPADQGAVATHDPDDNTPADELQYADKGVAADKKQSDAASAATTIKLLHHYPINIGMAVLVGRGSTAYSVANKQIQSDSTSADISYDVLFQIYPLSFYKSASGYHFGRVFQHEYESAGDFISVIGGFSVANPTTSLFAGVGFEPFVGMSFVAGWQPRRLPVLKPGFTVGQPNGDSSVPTNSEWSLRTFAIGINLDASVAKTIVAAFSK